MTALLFLGIAVVITVIGVLAMWFRHRQPSSFGSSISAFEREMQALSPDSRSRREHERRAREGEV